MLHQMRVELASSDGQRLCSACRAINFDAIFRRRVNRGRSRWVCRGSRVRSLAHVNYGSKDCDLCYFFGRLIASPDIVACSRLDLNAFSARAAFSMPKGIIPESVMLALPPPKPKYRFLDRQANPLSRARVVMECSDRQERLAGRRIGPKVDFGLLKSWLDFCGNHHSELCQRTDVSSIFDFRVIDCSTRRVVLWSHLEGPAEFAALSYVWGGIGDDCSIVLGSSLPETLPQTVENAIEATLKLGLGYLWIDRYCIPKDDAEEKHTQIQKMNLIYGSSAVTIIAAAGKDPTYGLPGVGTTRRRRQHSIRIGDRTLICTDLDIWRQLDHSTWNSRGWTYQEAFLSKRRLVFTDTMVYFQCNAMNCLETVSIPLQALHTKDLTRMRDTVSISRLWPLRLVGKYPSDMQTRIEEYAFRNLSFPSDALNAFEGLLSEFKALDRPVPNFCGLPIFDSDNKTGSLIVGLSWSVQIDYNTRTPPLGSVRKRPGFPTWSWACWDLSGSVYRLSYEISESYYLNERRPANFLQDRSTLKRMVPMVDIEVQMSGGGVLSWAQASDQIMKMVLMGRSFPEILHITGHTIDARIEKPYFDPGRSGWPDKYNWILNTTSDEPSLLMHSRIIHRYSYFSWKKILQLAESVGIPAYPAPDGKYFYHFRFLLLGRADGDNFSNDKWSYLYVLMILHRPQGSATYERVGIARDRVLVPGRYLQSTIKDDEEELAKWGRCTTQIA